MQSQKTATATAPATDVYRQVSATSVHNDSPIGKLMEETADVTGKVDIYFRHSFLSTSGQQTAYKLQTTAV